MKRKTAPGKPPMSRIQLEERIGLVLGTHPAVQAVGGDHQHDAQAAAPIEVAEASGSRRTHSGIMPFFEHDPPINASSHPAARRAQRVPQGHRRRRAERDVPAEEPRLPRLHGGRRGARSAARTAAQGHRHRDQRASPAGQEAVPQLLRHRPPLPPLPRPLRAQGDRGLDLPPPGPGGRRRHADPPRQHLRQPGGRRLPPRLHRERAVLRHRDVLGDRLRGRASGRGAPDHPDDRRSHGPPARRPGAHAARGGAGRAPQLQHRPRHLRGDPRPCAARSSRAAPRASWTRSTRSCARASRGAPSSCCTTSACWPTSFPRPIAPSPSRASGCWAASAAWTTTATPAWPPPTSSRTRCCWARCWCRWACPCGGWRGPRRGGTTRRPGPRT